MLPVLDQLAQHKKIYARFIKQLRQENFRGDIQEDYASRISTAVDNSIYQVIPEVVLFPKNTQDIEKILMLTNKPRFQSVKFSARGAGTGTNGQSLCQGVIIDSSRYLDQILEVNLDKGYVRVEPGVVLDQLNEVLQKHGVFFAPNLSPSNRATIGGMASTDACGKGSRIYGRTSQHILAINCVLSNGQMAHITETDVNKINSMSATVQSDDLMMGIYQTVQSEIIKQYDLIEAQFPKLDRFMTGYNLAKAYNREKNTVNLNYLIAGSEGTLVYITELTLKLTPLPRKKALFAISYPSFNQALSDAKSLLNLNPAAIETVDDNILALARQDEIYPQIQHMIECAGQNTPRAINLIEFICDDEIQLQAKLKLVSDGLNNQQRHFYCATKHEEITSLWELRKKGVGLLGAMPGARKPIPFMEDTAVPPENLADYITELRALLDHYGLKYGMFGHVDVGCLHMRPALDMNDTKDRQLVMKLTKEVNALVKKYGGVYWSEHGKGFRSEYVKDYFGEKLYVSLQKIKKAFDPYNQLNPGKVVVPYLSHDQLVKVDGPFRGVEDAQVTKDTRALFSGAFDCNGNSACLNYNLNQIMCPSAKASRNWVYSPKGRTALLREWLKQLSIKGYEVKEKPDKYLVKKKVNKKDFSYEVYDSLQKCLGCKACATACPIKVDIPNMKPLFLAHYHSRYRRPLRDYLIKNTEKISLYQAKWPVFFNAIQQANPIKNIINKYIGLVDSPVLSHQSLQKELQHRKVPVFSWKGLQNISEQYPDKVVCIVQDAFTSCYDAKVVLSVYDFLTMLGYVVYVLPFMENGKAAHVKGFLGSFVKKAQKTTAFYNQIAKLGVPLIGIDPSMTLVYRDEYKRFLKDQVNFHVYLFQEWFVNELSALNVDSNRYPAQKAALLAHCSERSQSAVSMIYWQKIFKAFNIALTIEKVGCCGMAGTFGHEKENVDMSYKVFESSWQPLIQKNQDTSELLASGFSCRCQVKRFAKSSLSHPVQYLVKMLKK
ncbi:FAD-binding and (Fe-S)-binding domain-containing protein [Facilibium subflavum]|uniref:FAD-binding and (Fe-S)-binding domain-containing protein n=1 Tax=Facilibium subflavum TaxID=2219058 RepID=UPI000E647133|nr:FAD-binding and (Fe-S)-binding domain-containing protein [Facilibium subflavum]